MRLASLDIGRMIACLAVVFAHAHMYFNDETTRVLGSAGGWAVMYFMILSGYVLAYPFVKQPGYQHRKFQVAIFLNDAPLKFCQPTMPRFL